MPMPMVAFLVIPAVLAFPGHALADVIYKSVGRDGSVTYSAAPLPDAQETMKIDLQQLTPEQRRAALLLRQQLKGANQVLEEGLRRERDSWLRVDREIGDARDALNRAEIALEAGRDPRPGELLGKLGGGARLAGDYFERLKSLDDLVQRAKGNLDRAYEARNALR